MRATLVIFAIVFAASSARSQYGSTLIPDRPGVAIASSVVGAQVFQAETGVDYATSDDETFDGKTVVWNNVIRFGLTGSFEVNALVNVVSTEGTTGGVSQRNSGVASLHLGTRYAINQPEGYLPGTGVQLRLKLPTVTKAFKAEYVAPDIGFMTTQSFSECLALATNWFLVWDGNGAEPQFQYVLNLGFVINDALSCFLENYGSNKARDFQTRFDGGFVYLVTNDLALDLSGGLGKNNSVTDGFVSAGVSIRFASR